VGLAQALVHWMGSTSTKGNGRLGFFLRHWFEWRFWVIQKGDMATCKQHREMIRRHAPQLGWKDVLYTV